MECLAMRLPSTSRDSNAGDHLENMGLDVVLEASPHQTLSC